MKGDPRIEGTCPGCGHVVRPGPPRKTRGHVKVTTTEAVFKRAMRGHMIVAHADLSVREQGILIERAWQGALAETGAGPVAMRGHACARPDPSDPVPSRPDEPAHASGRAGPPSDVHGDKPFGSYVAVATK